MSDVENGDMTDNLIMDALRRAAQADEFCFLCDARLSVLDTDHICAECHDKLAQSKAKTKARKRQA